MELRELRSGEEDRSWETHLGINMIVETRRGDGPFIHVTQRFFGLRSDDSLKETVLHCVGKKELTV